MTDDLLNQTALTERGWTKTMIPRFLPEPILKPNPFYRSAAPMKLWRKEDVENAEATEEFAKAKSIADKRKKSAEKAVETKTNALRADMKAFIESIRVEVIPNGELRKLAVEARQMWYEETEQTSKYGWDAMNADQATKDRWVVNFIRHNLTEYDENLAEMKGKTGVRELYPEYKEAILKKIAEAYPKYRRECERQISQLL